MRNDESFVIVFIVLTKSGEKMQIKELTKEEKMTIAAALQMLEFLAQGGDKGDSEIWAIRRLINSGVPKDEIKEICMSLLARLIKQ